MTNDPLQVFAAAVDALSNGEWLRAASYCDQDSLIAFKADAQRRYDPNESYQARMVTAEEYLRSNPAMPREVAEYFVAQRGSRPSLSAQLRGEFPGFATYQQLAGAPGQEVFAAWLRGRSLRHEIEKVIGRGVIQPEHIDAALADAGSEYRYRLIGWLPEGDRLAHILFREDEVETSQIGDPYVDIQAEGQYRFDLDIVSAPLIATCRSQADGTWRLMASYAFLKRSASGWFGIEAENDGQADQSEV
jgi:hypothetical protein